MESINPLGHSARVLLLGLVLVLPGLALAQRSTPAARKTSAKEDGFQPRLQTAKRLYEELEYEQALSALAHATTLAKTDDERAQVALYEGIVLAELGQRPESLTAFREALSLKLDARLPVKVSPKMTRDFETIRAEVRTEREAQARAKAPPLRPSTDTTDRPIRSPGLEPERVATPTPEHPGSAPGGDLDDWSMNEQRSSRIRPLPVALLGAGVVAGGVGGYFGLRSQGNIQNAREARLAKNQIAYLDEARGQALAANLLFGVAVTAAAGAVITWFTGNETTHTEKVSP